MTVNNDIDDDSATKHSDSHKSPSPDHRTWYTGIVNTVLRYSNVLHLQRVCHKVGDTMVRTSRFTFSFWQVGRGLFGLPAREF